MRRLHLGCGKRDFGSGWTNVDLAAFPHVHYVHDIATLPMFDDQSFDLVYSSHALAYFDRVEAASVLREWKRVLVAGGTLRIAVPDFEALVKAYPAYGLGGIIGPLFGRWQVGDTVIHEKTTYDFEALKALLEAVGFAGVRRYDWRDTEHASYDDHSQAYLPHMDKERGLLVSLNVEATK
jgi:ubiquinone/menaquinone biosynthesis C-methylase UbiE